MTSKREDKISVQTCRISQSRFTTFKFTDIFRFDTSEVLGSVPGFNLASYVVMFGSFDDLKV